MSDKKILIAEDDENIRQGLIDTLESDGYEVVAAKTGKAAIDTFNKEEFDLILLDIMMPEKSGYDVLMEVRRKNSLIPVLMLTAKSEEVDKVVGLNLGADDYITKPFGIHELLARIKAALRRSEVSPNNKDKKNNHVFEFGNCIVDSKTFVIKCKYTTTQITNRELEIMKFFYSRIGEVIKRDELLNEIWGVDYYGTTRTLDQHIAMLRKKIETDPSNPEFIKTVHGVGYRYCKTD